MSNLLPVGSIEACGVLSFFAAPFRPRSRPTSLVLVASGILDKNIRYCGVARSPPSLIGGGENPAIVGEFLMRREGVWDMSLVEGEADKDDRRVASALADSAKLRSQGTQAQIAVEDGHHG